MTVYVVIDYSTLEIRGIFSEVSAAHFYGSKYHYDDYFVEEHTLKN